MDALAWNAGRIISHIPVPVIGVVKCDGYGVSLTEAARVWQAAGVTMFAVSLPEEAIALRQAGFSEDILLMSPVADVQTLNAMLDNGIILTITGFENAGFYALNAEGNLIRAHVAVDTGMGRFGIRWTDTEQLTAVYSMFGFSVEGIFSHFAKSFEKKFERTAVQLERFQAAVEALEMQGFQVGMRHIANSCAALRFPQTHLDAVRIGSGLIGCLCGPCPVSLRSAAVLKAQVVDCKWFYPGDTTGYASVWKIRRSCKAVIVAAGRENGFGVHNTSEDLPLWDFFVSVWHSLQARSRRPCALYQGQELPLLGRIGNQYTLFDATQIDIRPGEYVSLPVNMMYPQKQRRFL